MCTMDLVSISCREVGSYHSNVGYHEPSTRENLHITRINSREILNIISHVVLADRNCFSNKYSFCKMYSTNNQTKTCYFILFYPFITPPLPLYVHAFLSLIAKPQKWLMTCHLTLFLACFSVIFNRFY